jgi:hypothetical protein
LVVQPDKQNKTSTRLMANALALMEEAKAIACVVGLDVSA